MRNKDDYKEDDHNKTNNQFEEDMKMCNLQKYIMHSNHWLIRVCWSQSYVPFLSKKLKGNLDLHMIIG